MDFDDYVKTLFDEAHKGEVHLAILDGLNHVDPYILNHAPMFWSFTVWAHAIAATLYATKLFDPDDRAFPVTRFFYMARLRAEEFAPGRKEEMLKAVDEGKARYEALEPKIISLARLRNKMYAHISEELINGTVDVVETKVFMEQIKTVLTEADAVLNSLTALCRYSISVSFNETHQTDYRKVFKLLNEGLCREADKRDEEYSQYGGSFRSPRPRDCSKTKGEQDGTSKVA
jgi:hypothetical protein